MYSSHISDIFFNGMISLAWIVVNLYIIAVEFRFLMNWFLNVNPFYEPFLSLWLWTNPIFCFGRSFYPKIFSWEPAPLINFQILYLIQAKLGSFVKNLNTGLPPEMAPEFTVPEFYSIPDWVNEMLYGIQKLLLEIKEWFYSFWDSCLKTDFLRKFLETFSIFFDKLHNQPHPPQGLDWRSVDLGIGEQLSGYVYVDEDTTLSLTINLNVYSFVERLLTPLFESDTLERVYKYSIDLDVSTLADIDILFQLNSHILI